MDFKKKRLSKDNIAEYVGETGDCELTEKTVSGVPALLQKDFGQKNNCTICSMTALLCFYTKKEPQKIYKLVVRKAGRLFFRPQRRGTNPFAVRFILFRCARTLVLRRQSKSRYIKGIGFGFEKIQSLTDKGTPMILSFHHDGNRYYKSHSVMVVGYAVCGVKRFLVIYDNWTAAPSYIDYDRLSIFASINYLQCAVHFQNSP